MTAAEAETIIKYYADIAGQQRAIARNVRRWMRNTARCAAMRWTVCRMLPGMGDSTAQKGATHGTDTARRLCEAGRAGKRFARRTRR